MKKLLIILAFLPWIIWGQYYTPLQYALVKFNTGLNTFQTGVVKYNIFNNYSQSSEGENLVNSKTGVELPYVSGYGEDQLFDLSVMQDTNFNKNAYIGNSFSLPEYYDFPYDTLYYDASNPYHWKMKDFHFRHYEDQADALTNIGFAKLTYGGYEILCTTSGVIYNSCIHAYGIWELDVYRGTGSNTEYINFIADQPNGAVNIFGYQLVIGSSEQITLRRVNNGSVTTLFTTAIGYVPNIEYVRLKIVRNSVVDEFVVGAIGTFGCYIKGGSFGDTYVLIDLTGGSGSNPVTDDTYTSCGYSVLDVDAFDRVKYYYTNEILQDFEKWTQSIVVYDVNKLPISEEIILQGNEQIDPKLSDIKKYINLIPDTDFYINE